MGRRYNTGVLFVLGGISGLVSFLLIRATYWGTIFVPGLLFGCVIGMYFLNKPGLGLRYFWFIIASTLSYCWAFLIVLYFSYGWGVVFDPEHTLIYNAYAIHSPLVVFTAGLIGTFFLLLSFRQFIGVFSQDAFLLLLMLGGTLSSSFFLGYLLDAQFPTQNLNFPSNQIVILSVVWQSCMAGALGWASSLSTAKKNLFIPVVIMLLVMVVTLVTSSSLMDAKLKKDIGDKAQKGAPTIVK